MPAEAIQEKGRRGVETVKRWLEATTFIELPWNAYENERFCGLLLLNGKVKRWDLFGFFLTDRRGVYVENKDYSSAGTQEDQYEEFLANCYSATARAIKDYGSSEVDFMWVTTHPFGKMSRWSKLATREAVLDALQKHESVLGDDEVPDHDLAAEVASRIWVLVFNKKQEALSLSRRELDVALAALKRKEPTL